MVINYEPFKWDPTKKFNPSNMNHMDNGIKAACDKADANEKVIDELNSNLIIANNDISGGYNYNKFGIFKIGKIQYFNFHVTFPVSTANLNTYFAVAYAPETPLYQETFPCVVSYGMKIIPALCRITLDKQIQIYLSDEIVALGSVQVTGFIKTNYLING